MASEVGGSQSQAAASTTSTNVGARASLARAVIRKASERVCERITLDNMEQSFPDFVEGDKAYIEELQKQTIAHLEAGFSVNPASACEASSLNLLLSQSGFNELFTESEFKDFDARANTVDQVLAAASNRRARREEPQDAWKYVNALRQLASHGSCCHSGWGQTRCSQFKLPWSRSFRRT